MPVSYTDLCAEAIITTMIYLSKLWIFAYKTGKSFTKPESSLQKGIWFYKSRTLITKRDFRITNGILALQFTGINQSGSKMIDI